MNRLLDAAAAHRKMRPLKIWESQMEMRLPLWIRAVLAVSALMQLVFGITLIASPAQIAEVWPWVMPPLTARVLGASALVSVPMVFIAVSINRYALAAIPFVMMATYRVVQLAAGGLHFDRFGAKPMIAANYFGGGVIMLAVLIYALWSGQSGRLPAATSAGGFVKPMPWHVPRPIRLSLAGLGLIYVALGVTFFVAPAGVAEFWMDARGMTPLTARLFSGSLIGLGLGIVLLSQAGDWRSAVIPAVGLVTVGVAANIAFIVGHDDFALKSLIGWAVAATPTVSLLVGTAVLAAKPRLAPARA
jgi:hypothetical protein